MLSSVFVALFKLDHPPKLSKGWLLVNLLRGLTAGMGFVSLGLFALDDLSSGLGRFAAGAALVYVALSVIDAAYSMFKSRGLRMKMGVLAAGLGVVVSSLALGTGLIKDLAEPRDINCPDDSTCVLSRAYAEDNLDFAESGWQRADCVYKGTKIACDVNLRMWKVRSGNSALVNLTTNTDPRKSEWSLLVFLFFFIMGREGYSRLLQASPTKFEGSRYVAIVDNHRHVPEIVFLSYDEKCVKGRLRKLREEHDHKDVVFGEVYPKYISAGEQGRAG